MNEDAENIRKVVVARPRGNTLPSQLVALHKILQGVGPQEKVEFDFSPLTWVNPLMVLPLAAFVHTTNSSYIPPTNIASYFSAVQFPHGAKTINELQKTKNYIPIGLLTRDDPTNRDKLESAFLRLLSDTIRAVPYSENALFYPINELLTNIFDHSKKDEGWILAQWYPGEQFLDLCIVDCGRGLSKAYQEELQLMLTDDQAIEKALDGLSIKKIKERGFGLRTSKSIVCRALQGSFLLISGSSALIAERDKEKIADLPQFYWQGVIVAYRIPKPKGPVDITPYLE